jgi:hypothetical protein
MQRSQQDKKAELVLENYNLKSFEAMRMRETFQQIYQAPDSGSVVFLCGRFGVVLLVRLSKV